jgi:hypothetical protein
MKRIVGIGGLANRLRAILSARAAFGEIEALWATSTAVHGASYTDCFEPIPGVAFIHAGEVNAHDLSKDQWHYDVMTSNPVEEAPEGWTLGYRDVKPKRGLLEICAKLRSSMGMPYAAVHARRLDHAAHAPTFGHFTTNEEFAAWVDNALPGPLYLAADCPQTHAWFKARYPGLCAHRVPEQVHGYEVRPGTLADAVVDMWMCVEAAQFKGSWMSSYSETIGLLRCGGAPDGGFVPRLHMQSADAEFYRGRPDRARAFLAGEPLP